MKIEPAKEFVAFPEQGIEQSIPTRFEQIVSAVGPAPAVRSGGSQIDYETLNRQANRVANTLLSHPADRGEPVVTLLPHGFSYVAAVMGVLKAGRAYLPLDPTLPEARNARIIAESGARVILTDTLFLDPGQRVALDGQDVLNVDGFDPSVPLDNPGLEIAPDALAYVVYTSGSTGDPKGVVQNHRGVLHNVMRHTNALFISRRDRISLLYPTNVYGGLREIFNALLNGACLCPYPVKDRGVSGLADWLVDEGITMYGSVVTVFRHFVDSLDDAREFPRLRLVKVGGEAVYTDDIERFKKHMSPECRVLYGLGSTETGIVSLLLLDRSTRIGGPGVPLGYPATDMEVLLLDEQGRRARPGEVGEIAVKSRYVALGYWRRPDLTEAAFRFCEDGKRIYLTGDLGVISAGGLVHRGRKNQQVKIQGNRVDVSEVERTIATCPAVREAAVVVKRNARDEDCLVAFWSGERDSTTTEKAFRQALGRTLPVYAIPSAFVPIDRMPLIPNGKVDRQALLGLAPERPVAGTPVEPRTPIEAEIAAIWAELLRVDRVGVHDSFFALGGQSLSATQAISRINQEFGVQLPSSALFESPSVEEIALLVLEELLRESRSEPHWDLPGSRRTAATLRGSSDHRE